MRTESGSLDSGGPVRNSAVPLVTLRVGFGTRLILLAADSPARVAFPPLNVTLVAMVVFLRGYNLCDKNGSRITAQFREISLDVRELWKNRVEVFGPEPQDFVASPCVLHVDDESAIGPLYTLVVGLACCLEVRFA